MNKCSYLCPCIVMCIRIYDLLYLYSPVIFGYALDLPELIVCKFFFFEFAKKCNIVVLCTCDFFYFLSHFVLASANFNPCCQQKTFNFSHNFLMVSHKAVVPRSRSNIKVTYFKKWPLWGHSCFFAIFNPFPNKLLVFTHVQYKSIENTGGKEVARNEQCLLFPQCFLL